MANGSETGGYWLLRLAQAMEKAGKAPTEQSCTAYLDLARHYWFMHLMVNGPRAQTDFRDAGIHCPELARIVDPASVAELQRAA